MAASCPTWWSPPPRLDRAGKQHTLSREDLGLSYRHSDVPEDWIFTSAVLRGHPGDHAEISHRMHEIADVAGGKPAGAGADRRFDLRQSAG